MCSLLGRPEMFIAHLRGCSLRGVCGEGVCLQVRFSLSAVAVVCEAFLGLCVPLLFLKAPEEVFWSTVSNVFIQPEGFDDHGSFLPTVTAEVTNEG